MCVKLALLSITLLFYLMFILIWKSLSIASSRTIQLALFFLHCDSYAYQSIVMKDIPSLEFFLVG